MARSGHTACSGQTGALGTERDVQVTDGDLGHGVRVHMFAMTNIYAIKHKKATNLSQLSGLLNRFLTFLLQLRSKSTKM